MSVLPLAETLKNTIEVLNEIYEIQNSGSGLQWILFLKLSWNIVFDQVTYILTCQWVNDFIKLPIFLPQVSESIFSDFFHHLVDNQSYESFAGYPLSFKDALPLDITSSNTFFQTSFFNGFCNCFFLYVPISPVQFIWLRRIIIDGQWSGRAATFGIIFGHLSLLGCCLFGFRDIINVWFGLEPLSYFFGVWLIFIVIFEMAHKPFPIFKKSQKKELLKIFLISFGLVWTDQFGFYQYFGHLTLHSGINIIDFSFYNSQFSIFIYYLGIVVGSFFWTYVISQGILRLGYLFPRLTRFTYSYWIRGCHNFCLIGCITLTLTSFPYYGPDYLFTNPLGFFAQDSAFEATSLLKTETKDVKKGRLGEKSSLASVDTDLSLFDRGRYAGGPVVEFHLESLNYQQEYAWRSRFDRRGLIRGGGLLDQYLTTQFGPVEEARKKQRREKKRAQQMEKFIRTTEQDSIQNLLAQQAGGFAAVAEPPTGEAQAPSMKSENSSSSEDVNNFNDLNLNKFIDQSPNDLMENYEDLIERFVENYTAEANFEDFEVPDLVNEKMINFSAFSEITKYGFDLFSMFDAVELNPVDEELARDIKEKFSDNLVYKFLVRFDISNFLKRQPKAHQLTSNDEISLFEKRLALGEYYDTLRSYSQLPLSNIFQPLFGGPKSYINRIYNQQFKGTLKIVERLFSIHLEDEDNIPNLPNNEENKKSDEIYYQLKKEPSVLKFDQPLYKKNFLDKNPLIHEQFLEHMPSSIQTADLIPFIKEGRPLPFFVGWDNEKRKFIITNRLLTRQKTLSETSILKNKNNFRQYSYINLQKTQSKSSVKLTQPLKILENRTAERPTIQSFKFTTWPVTEKAFQTNPLLSRLFRTYDEMKGSAEDLYTYAEPLMEEESLIYDKLPSLVQRIEVKNKLQMSLAPRRGGFLWPGNESFKFPIPPLSQYFKKLQNFGFFKEG